MAAPEVPGGEVAAVCRRLSGTRAGSAASPRPQRWRRLFGRDARRAEMSNYAVQEGLLQRHPGATPTTTCRARNVRRLARRPTAIPPAPISFALRFASRRCLPLTRAGQRSKTRPTTCSRNTKRSGRSVARGYVRRWEWRRGFRRARRRGGRRLRPARRGASLRRPRQRWRRSSAGRDVAGPSATCRNVRTWPGWSLST